MQPLHYLKNMFLVYLITSIILGFAISSLILVNKYNNHLENTLNTIKNINNNTQEVKNQIDKMEGMINYLKDDLELAGIDTGSEMPFFQVLDSIKKHLKGASITITAFKEVDGEKILPVQIIVPITNYPSLVDYAGFIELFSITPSYEVKSFSLSKSLKGEYSLNIQGVLKAPLLKTKT